MPATMKAIAPSSISQVPRTSGVYEIRCLANGKFYIGSAVNLRDRWQNHQYNLRRGNHHNILLQTAWNKYGEQTFVFSVLQFVERELLLQAEQRWIDKTRCTNRKIGFNLYPIAGSPGEIHAQTWTGFISPEGNEVTIHNLAEFCRVHGLNPQAMMRLAKGKSKLRGHQGWSHKNSVRKRDYVKTYEGFIDPHGQLVNPITNMAAFCREHDLEKSHLLAVMRGRICSHRGWTHINSRKPAIKVHTGYINPEGQRVQIINLVAFCKENGLQVMHMHDIRKGYRKSHKGWTWRPDNE
jgi:group I intron endonuclease